MKQIFHPRVHRLRPFLLAAARGGWSLRRGVSSSRRCRVCCHGDFVCGAGEQGGLAFGEEAFVFVQWRSVRRAKPSALHSSLPTPWWTKKRPAGSYFFFTAASLG